ncbi:MAG: endolytic transglycosylase MltG [Candidatus Peregrinibacteria bacterium]|nr:endolytic transglycosylase MltG [Candidatus Peregrinibacteria bacterium]MDZ4245050.1 endolytic transglycosylase MltG [Candidatus Gracilibacteria bacterium]
MAYRRRRKRRQPFMRFLVYMAIIAVCFFGTKYYYTQTMLSPVDITNESKVAFEISNGESLKEISEGLKDKELINSPSVFRSYLKRKKMDINVKAGNFILNRAMSAQQIAETITNDKVAEEAVTIQEGLTVAQIDDKLSSAGLISKGELINFSINNLTEEEVSEIPSEFLNILQENHSNLEGLLFPDTYFINRSSFSLNAFVIRLIKTMNSNITDDMRKTYETSSRDLYEILNMASIIEREVRTKDDIPLVAGILWKRYDSNWALGADATILYVTQGSTLTLEELDIDSAYNTRKFLGLPPTPISNPGISSLKGAVYPKYSDYWYYLTTLNTGEVIYAETNEKHNINKAKYLK